MKWQRVLINPVKTVVVEALIKRRPDALQQDLLAKIKLLIRYRDVENIIPVREKTSVFLSGEEPGDYMRQLRNSIGEFAEGKTVSFTMKKFGNYVKENFSE